MGAIEIEKSLKAFPLINQEKLEIIIVDDNPEFKDVFTHSFSALSFEVIYFSNPIEANEYLKLKNWNVVLIVSDYSMPTWNGFTFREESLKYISPSIPFFLVSGVIDVEQALNAIQLKIFGFLDKQNADDKILSLVERDLLKRVADLRDDREMLLGFVDDANSMIEQMESLSIGIEENNDTVEIIQKMLGIAHTIKGASSFFEPKYLHSYIHKYEDYLKSLSTNLRPVNDEEIELCLLAIDDIKFFLNQLATYSSVVLDVDSYLLKFQQNSVEHSDKQVDKHIDANHNDKKIDIKAEKDSKQNNNNDSVKIEKKVLDSFMYASGEMTVIRNMLYKVSNVIEKKFPQDKDVQSLSELLEELHKINLGVQNKISDLRKIGVSSILKPVPRLIRDVSKQLGKKINFEVEGSDLKLDNTVADIINNSILHLLKNCMDHGLENTEERIALGKSEAGNIKLEFKHFNDSVIFSILDDGRGIDPKKIKNKLLQTNYDSYKLDKMSELDLQMMVFDSGFSTAEKVTEISGRGVGMTAIKDLILEAGGEIVLDSKVGKGTRFEFKIPVPKSVNIKNCLFVKIKNQEYGIDQDSILHVLTVDQTKSDISLIDSSYFINFDNKLVPILDFYSITEASKIGEIDVMNRMLVVVKTQTNNVYAVLVDEVFEFEDTVIKNIPNIIKKSSIYKGATFLSDGRVGMLLDMDGIYKQLAVNVQTTYQKSEKTNPVLANNKMNTWFEFELFNGNKMSCNQNQVFRIETIGVSSIFAAENGLTCIYRDSVMSLLNLSSIVEGKVDEKMQIETDIQCLVVNFNGSFVGLIVNKILDIFDAELITDAILNDSKILGHVMKANELFSVLDLEKVCEFYVQNSCSSLVSTLNEKVILSKSA